MKVLFIKQLIKVLVFCLFYPQKENKYNNHSNNNKKAE